MGKQFLGMYDRRFSPLPVSDAGKKLALTSVVSILLQRHINQPSNINNLRINAYGGYGSIHRMLGTIELLSCEKHGVGVRYQRLSEPTTMSKPVKHRRVPTKPKKECWCENSRML
jgi:hypothetical protein